MKLYLAGPMRGKPQYNFPAFDAAAAFLRDRGFDVVSPAEMDRDHGFDGGQLADSVDTTDEPPGFDLRKALSRDLNQIFFDCEGVAVLEGWEYSRGATAEVAVALALGKPIYDATTAKRITVKLRGHVDKTGLSVCEAKSYVEEIADEPADPSPLKEAQRVVNGARRSDYGHPLDNHQCSADLARTWLKRRHGVDVPLDATDIPWLMILFKASREAHSPKFDNRVDVAGYAENVDMILAERARRDRHNSGPALANYS